jgi:hypothetical protein
MIIYFIQVENDGAVKIGQTGNLQDRLRALQHNHHQKLNVLYSFDVPDEKANYAEKHLHKCFTEHQIRGEWFSPCPYMYDYIAKISKDGFWVNSMDDYEEYISSDKFNGIYNHAFDAIEKARAYGDFRRVRNIVEDLEELATFARTGRLP